LKSAVVKALFIFKLLVIVQPLSACGTIKTFKPENGHLEISYFGSRSYCGSIPHIYSGVAYDFCLLHGEWNPNVPDHGHVEGIPWVAVDIVLSAALETVLLPYKIYLQATRGSIVVN